ncbi:MAG: hypothetical protein LH645_09850 [Actinomycetia bacterium]|nr:hypothetical protein [Actinomycetes bacterium]
MLGLGVVVVVQRLYAFRLARLNPIDGPVECKPKEGGTMVDCVDPAAVPTFWPPVLSGAGFALVGILLLLGVVVAKLRAHAADVSRATGT